MLATVPETITGPAIMNIFAHIPKIIPSFLNSMAGLVMEFENPVIGTIVPAPANAPILSNTPIPVKNDAKNIRMISVYAQALCVDTFGKIYKIKSLQTCPSVHIIPPTQNELKRLGQACVFAIFASTYALNLLFLSFSSILTSQNY